MEEVSWGPALAALAAGLAAGMALVWRLRATARVPPSASEEADVRRRDLEAHRDTLLDQLRELDDVGGDRDPELLARERDRLELQAARVLAELDRQAPAPARTPAPAPAAPGAVDARRAARRGFTWGIASAAAAAALVVWVSGAARPRGADGQLTGNLPERTPGQAATPAGADPELARLQQSVAANPEDLDARLELTQAYLGRSDMMQVWEQTQEVLARSPGHPRALSYQALVRLAMGQAGAAEEQLKQAMAAAPDLLEPRLHLSLVYMRTGRQAEADAVLDEAGRRFPAQKAALERLRTEMKAAEQGVEPMAPVDHPDVGAAAGGLPRPGGARVSGQIELDPARGAAPAGSIVFVTARAAGQSEGPPLAVKRLPAAFPLSFTLGAEDSMMGQELPQELRLDVRLDTDGDPMTRAAGDATARIDPVRLGQDGLRVRLR
jgi:hypothetical protein